MNPKITIYSCRDCAVFAPSASSSGMSCDCLAHRLGNAADQPDRTRRYGSDLTDAEWAIVRPLLPVPAWLNGRGGRPEGYCHRQMVDQCHEVKGLPRIKALLPLLGLVVVVSAYLWRPRRR